MLSATVGVSIPAMGDAPSSGTGGDAGLVFWRTGGFESSVCKPASCIKPYTGGQKKARTKLAYER